MNVIRWLDKHLEAVVISSGLMMIVAVMTSQIVYRKIFGSSLIWSEELCRHIFICIACWGLSYSIRIGNAIKFDMLVSLFPAKAKYVFEMISNIFMIAFFAYMFKPSWDVSVSMREMSATALPYHMDLIHFIALAGFTLSGVRAFQVLLFDIKTLLRGEEPGKEKAL